MCSSCNILCYFIKVGKLESIRIVFNNAHYAFCADESLRPRYHLAVSVLADNVCVNIFRVNVKIITEKITKSCRIKRSTGAYNFFAVESRKLPCNLCHNVNRIGCNKENSVKTRIYYRRNYCFENLSISLKQRQPVFSGLLTYAGAYNYYVRISAIGIRACIYLHICFSKR